jgi:hypothetical protein
MQEKDHGTKGSGQRRGRGAALFFFLLILQASVLQAELVDRIVAAVNSEVITWSDLQHAVGFNAALAGDARSGKNIQAETLEGLINRRLLVLEARRLKFADVTAQDISAEVDKLRKRFESEKAFSGFLAGLGMTEEQLGRMLGERLLVERFIEKKIGLFVRVSRGDAQKYYDEHPGDFQGKRFQEVHKAISAALSEQKLDRQLVKYLGELKNRADIRVNPLGG